MKKFIQLSVVMASAIYLTGCGGGGSNSSQPSSDAKTVMKIGNETPFDFASVTVQSTNGTTHYYDGQFKCVKTDTKCYLNINQDINESVTLLFKDGNGRVVSADVLADVPGTYISLYPSAMSTGFYLVSRLARDLKASDNLSWTEVNDRVQNFFTNYDSPDGTLDPYEEVGDYYTSQLIKGVGSEADFLSAFEQRLLKWDVAQSDELPKPGAQYANLYQRVIAQFKPSKSGLISYAFAQEASCGTGLSTFLNFTENLASIIPVVGDAVSGAAAIGNSYCDDTDAKLDKIMSQLNDLQNSVNVVDQNVGAIGRFLYTKQANDKTTEFENLTDEVKDRVTQYKSFLNSNNVTSLQEYFSKKGGWDAAIANGSEALDNLLSTAYKNPNTKTLFYNTLNTTRNADFQSYLDALSERCSKQPTSSEDNFIMTRQQCNNIIQANSGRLVAAQGMLLPIVKDVYTVLEAYKEKAQKIYLPSAILPSYATAYSDIKNAFSKQQTDMVEAYKAKIGGFGYFNAFEGLNQGLIDSLVSRQCEQNGKDRANGPAIIGWYQPNTNSQNNYIVTNCKMGWWRDRIVARYYYNDQGNVDTDNITNVLGVPVATAYTKEQGKNEPDPLYYSSQGMASRTRWEDMATSSDSKLSVYLDAPTASAVALLNYRDAEGGVITPNLFKLNNLYDLPSYAEDKSKYQALYVLVPSKSGYFRVARLNMRFTDLYTRASLDCIASPCRVNPSNEEWIIFTEDGETLDSRPTNQSYGGRRIMRLAPVGQ